jgi:hypothetical protein
VRLAREVVRGRGEPRYEPWRSGERPGGTRCAGSASYERRMPERRSCSCGTPTRTSRPSRRRPLFTSITPAGRK